MEEKKQVLLIFCGLKIVLPVLSLIWSIASPYQMQTSHIPLLKEVMIYLSYLVKTFLIGYILSLSLAITNIMRFFYLNTLVVLIINMFRQSSQGLDFKRFKVTGYFQFIIFATSAFLVGFATLVLRLELDQNIEHKSKKAFLFDVYAVASAHPGLRAQPAAALPAELLLLLHEEHQRHARRSHCRLQPRPLLRQRRQSPAQVLLRHVLHQRHRPHPRARREHAHRPEPQVQVQVHGDPLQRVRHAQNDLRTHVREQTQRAELLASLLEEVLHHLHAGSFL